MTESPPPGQARPGQRSEVRKVVRLVAASPVSWADATRRGVAEAAKTIRDLGTATVARRDALIQDGRIVMYRVQLEVSFRLDREREVPGTDHEVVEVKRYLVVANKSLASPDLAREIRKRQAAGPCEFHVVVPATSDATRWASLAAGSDPVGGLAADANLVMRQLDEAQAEAEARLETHVEAMRELGADVTSEIGSADPYTAARTAMDRSSFDEIIISTLPAGVSKWLRMDLESRLRRSTQIPITVCTPPD